MKTHIALFALFAAATAWSAQVVDVKFKALDGFGGDTGSIASRCQTKKGQEYDPATLTRDVGALKDSSEFEDISADAQRVGDGVEITFYVKRKMRYSAPATVKGANAFSVSKVLKEAELKVGYLYGEADLAEAADRVRTAYYKKHYYDAKVSPVVEMLPEGDGGTVTFIIDEGVRQKIGSYVFAGAVGVSADELLEAINVLPWWNPLGWFSDSPVTPEQQAQCVPKIEEVFRNRGYLDVKVAGPERVPREDGRVDVRFDIVEGVRYVVGDTKITGLTRYPEESVRAKSDLPAAGAVAGAKVLADAARRIEIAVGSGDSGLADTHVTVKHFPSESDPSVANIVFDIAEGVPVVINKVEIRGNDYTKDKVIRREITLGPGDRMLEDRAEQSKRRLENLDYFSRVRYELQPTDRGKDENGAEWRDLVYEVEEKNTGNFMVGIGAGSVDSVYAYAEVQQSNFDLFAPSKFFRGGGQKGRVFVQAGPRIQSYEASVTEPHFLDRYLELTGEVYRRNRWYDDYDVIRSGGGATLAYPAKVWNPRRFWDPEADKYVSFGRFGVRLGGEFIQMDDVENAYYVYKGVEKKWLKEEDRKYGDAAEAVVRFFWSRDDRDNFRVATRGSRSQVFLDVGAGDNEYYKIGISHRHYFSPWKGIVSGDSWLKEHVFMVGFRAETIDGFGQERLHPVGWPDALLHELRVHGADREDDSPRGVLRPRQRRRGRFRPGLQRHLRLVGRPWRAARHPDVPDPPRLRDAHREARPLRGGSLLVLGRLRFLRHINGDKK